MKKLGAVLVACTTLAACTSYEPDLDVATETRQKALIEHHQEVGCPMVDDHEAYRKCVIDTYYKNSPKTFVPAKLPDGRSLAIVRNDQTSSYDETTDTYKTERVVVIETVETIKGKPEKVIHSETINAGVIKTPPPEPVAPIAEQPVPEVKQEPAEKTWWETYQKEKTTEQEKPKCPCPDPNEPCPQCIDK